MSAKEEKREAFNEQMNAWVSRQGLWFQLRHAADGQTILARVMRLVARLALILVVLGICFWIYLVKRVEGDGFKEDLRASIETTLRGADCEIGSFSKKRETASLSYAKMNGTEESFFHSLDVRGIRTQMNLTDGLFHAWEGEILTIDQLDAEVKAGGSDDTGAAKAFQALFVEHKGFAFDRIECKSTNIKWGYSGANKGYIRGSHLTAGRENGGWKLEFRGGTFGQNWLKHLVIKKMVVLCYPQGVSIQQAELTAADGEGEIKFRVTLGGGSQPSVAGTVQFDSVPLKAMLPLDYTEWIAGTISGKGIVSGSTNSQDGVVLDLDLNLGDGDVVAVRDSIPLLSALSVVDLYNSYRKVSFDSGSFHLKTQGRTLSMSQFNLNAGDLLYLRGGVDVRPPTQKEIAKALEIEDVNVVRDILGNIWKHQNDELTDTRTGSSLSEHGKKIESKDSGVKSGKEAAEEVLRAAVMAELEVKRFTGNIKLGLKPDAFDKAPGVKEVYPVDAATNRIWMEVPLRGRLQTLTLTQAEQLYVLGRNRE